VTAPFPGAIGVSHLRVYDSEAPDGLRGGTPHLHTACTEAYAVAAGRGAVQTLSAAGFAETPIEAGSFVWFTPGTVHRLVNHGGLEIFVLMANAGLPEAGDMVLTFPAAVLDDPDAYAEVAVLPPEASTTTADDRAVRRRKDLAVEGFLQVKAGGAEALAAFHRQAATLVGPRVESWRQVWANGPHAEAELVGRQLARLAEGDPGHMADAAVHALPPPAAERRYGCCGTLGTYLP
jgi:mannose-6-phosphate isomerase-like protein (cupin superfamily)